MAPNLTLTPDLQAAEGTLAPTPAVQPVAIAPAPAAAPASTAGPAALSVGDQDAANAALQMRVTQPAPSDSFGAKLCAALDQARECHSADGSGQAGAGWLGTFFGRRNSGCPCGFG